MMRERLPNRRASISFEFKHRLDGGDAMNAHDPRVVFLRRARRVTVLHRGGRMNTDAAFEALIHPFLEIVGPAAQLCKHCGDPPWRHDEAWCAAVREGQARGAAEREATITKRVAYSTVEALVFGLRSGVKELGQEDTIHRLSELSDEQFRDVVVRLQKFQPPIAPAWKAEDIKVLIAVRRKARAKNS
jgi:hypothetical protein